MFRQYKCFIITDGAQVIALNENQELFWTHDVRKAYSFSSYMDAELYRRHNLKEEYLQLSEVISLVIQYIAFM